MQVGGCVCVSVLPEGRIDTKHNICLPLPLLPAPGWGIPWQWQLESSHSKHSSEFQQEEASSSSSSTLTVSDVQQRFPMPSSQFPNSEHRQISIHFGIMIGFWFSVFSVFSPFAFRICSSDERRKSFIEKVWWMTSWLPRRLAASSFSSSKPSPA